jgi:hypothetical protein
VTEYLNALSAELGTVGIRGSRRRRILAEAEDHLRESGDEARFGEPKVIAARFADELATNGARRTALFSLFALAPAGIGYALLFGLNRSGPDITSAKTPPLGVAAALVIALARRSHWPLGSWRLRSPGACAQRWSRRQRRSASSTGVPPSRSAQARQPFPVSRSTRSSTAAAYRTGGRPWPSR